ncbi:MAG TPA: hypothetical protein VGM82_19165 [Gemmatimonadaceae bacterium]
MHRPIGLKSKLAGLAFAVAALTAVACKGFTEVPASLTTVTESSTVYALNGAPLGAPTAIHAYVANGVGGAFVPADADFLFDVAFDIDSLAQVHILPQRQVAAGLQTTHTVSLATVPDTFEAVTRVPDGLTFRPDTGMIIARGQVVIAQVTDATACSFSITGTTLFAKIAVKAINRVDRTMQVKLTVDPNCGFRSFASGIPKD